MKKVLFLAMLAMSLWVLSCSRLPEPIALNDELSVYAELSENGDTLYGVKKTISGDVVIKPYYFHNFSCDDKFITFQDSEGTVCVYDITGKEFGAFDEFSHWNQDGDYYLGINNDEVCYYFVKTGETIKAEDEYLADQYLFLVVDGTCEIRNHDGVLVWQVPQNSIIMKIDAPKDGKMYQIVAPYNSKKYPYALYDVEGKMIRKLNAFQYKKMLQKTEEIATLGSCRIVM